MWYNEYRISKGVENYVWLLLYKIEHLKTVGIQIGEGSGL